MANTYSAVTTGFNVLDPNNLDGTPLVSMDTTGVYVNGTLIESNSSTAAVTAHAGGGQTSATAITTRFALVTVCATNGDSVKLPVLTVGGYEVTVKNIGAAILAVFPSTGQTINGLAANLSVDIPVGGELVFTSSSATAWRTPIVLTSLSSTTQTGNLVIKATASAGDYQTTITNASQAAARTYTVPDAGANASFVMGAGTQTVAGATTFTLAVPISATTNQLVLGTTNTTTLSATAPAASRVITFGDPLGADSVAYLAATQTLTGKTLTNFIDSGTVAGTTITAVTGTTGATLTNIPGLSVAVTIGTYAFKVYLTGTATTNCGVKLAVANSGSTTSGTYTGVQYNGTTTNARTTTTTIGNAVAAATTVFTDCTLEGTIIVSAGGNLTAQFAQNAAHADSTVINNGSYMTVRRIA